MAMKFLSNLSSLASWQRQSTFVRMISSRSIHVSAWVFASAISKYPNSTLGRRESSKIRKHELHIMYVL
jgi:hypothetical protein